MPENHLVILTGTRTPSKKQELKRQEITEEPFQSVKVPDVVASIVPVSDDTTVESAAAVAKNETDGDSKSKRNTYLTTPLITALLISFGVLIPIVVISISALASVQVPPRMLEIGKALSVDKSRKDQ